MQPVDLRHLEKTGTYPLETSKKLKYFTHVGARLLAVAVLLGAASPMRCELPVELLTGSVKLKKVVIPVYVGNQSEPVAVVTVDKTLTDFQRKGFFRIGLLPMVVLEGVTIEAVDPAKAAKALESLHNWLDPKKAGKAVELRKVRIVLDKNCTKLLLAASARFAADGRWELDAAQFQDGPIMKPAGRASLQVIGKDAGKIVFSGGDAVNLFDPKSRE